MHDCIDEIQNNSQEKLISLNKLLNKKPISSMAMQTVYTTRNAINKILTQEDTRFLVVIGPCSIHDPIAAIEYGNKLNELAKSYADTMLLVMRTYFEKPRTNLGWKGLIHDPYFTGKENINAGIELAYEILLELNALQIPTATEFLDPLISRYLSPLISWCAIGARTSESQIHRELASSLDMPVGFKNNTDGNIQVAIDAMQVALQSHQLITLNANGIPITITSQGNTKTHIILRGSYSGSNYDAENIAKTCDALRNANLPERIMIDCSHGNSSKDHTLQKRVLENILKQRNQKIFGIMIESFLIEGKQTQSINYGQSITDACIGWQETEDLIEKLNSSLSRRNQ